MNALSLKQQFQPKTYDIDAANHLNNIVYVRWMEECRRFWLDQYLPLKGLMAEGKFLAVKQTDIEYIIPVHLFDEVEVQISAKSISKTLVQLDYTFHVDGKMVACGRQEGVFILMETGQALRVPATLREQWEDAINCNPEIKIGS